MKENFIDDIDIQIFDENNRFIDFNNTDWSMVISVIYDKEFFEDTVNFDDYKKKSQEEEQENEKLESLGNKKNKKEKETIEESIEEPIKEPIDEIIPIPTMNENDLDLLLYNNHIYR
jgi:hypothetical protein